MATPISAARRCLVKRGQRLAILSIPVATVLGRRVAFADNTCVSVALAKDADAAGRIDTDYATVIRVFRPPARILTSLSKQDIALCHKIWKLDDSFARKG